MSAYLLPADLLLPDFEKVNGTAYATVACDQFTSDPSYWEKMKEFVGESPSTLQLILPEAYLGEASERVPQIHEAMRSYLREILVPHKSSMVYLERVQSDGKVRRGLVGMVDLELYDYHRGAQSLIRATEATVAERIPPRLAVRRDAPLELPHVMLLIDDPGKTVIEPIAARAATLEPLYAFPLAMRGGAVRARLVDSVGIGRIEAALSRLISPERTASRYGEGVAPLLFAVGDGNHSLATAKAAYEEIKAARGEEALYHPARFALVEVVNLYDSALQFEPIHRVLFGVEPGDVLNELSEYSKSLGGANPPQQVRVLSAGRQVAMHFTHPSEQLAVGTLQSFLDKYLSSHPAAHVDYIHGARAVESLCMHEGTVGFLLPAMPKEELFLTVIREGSLPRKTFSMGHAEDKRYYIEARRIK